MPAVNGLIYLVLLSLGLLVNLTLLVLVASRPEKTRVSWAYFLLSFLFLVWTLSDLLLIYSSPEKLWLWVRLRFSAKAFIGFAWLLLAICYVRLDKIKPRLLFPLLLPGLFSLAALLTNESHHLFFKSFARFNVYAYGPLFWVHANFTYLYVLAGILLYVWAALAHGGGPTAGRASSWPLPACPFWSAT